MHLADIILFCLLAALAASKDPPTFNLPYYIAFDETNVVNGTNFTNTAQEFYDPINNRQRVDFIDGKHDRICGTLLPDATTPCIHYIVENRRWIVFPNKNLCCFCCDSAHGCGLLAPDWLKGAEYLGVEKILDISYDKWSKSGSGYNYLWVSTDGKNIPRRLDEGGKHIKNFVTSTYLQDKFTESIFTLPPFCEPFTNCPLESTCGKFRLSSQ